MRLGKIFVCFRRFNLTEKEGSADRKVPVQPLVFYSKDGNVTRYNLRKVHDERAELLGN